MLRDQNLIPVEQAQSLVLDSMSFLETETVPLLDAIGRV